MLISTPSFPFSSRIACVVRILILRYLSLCVVIAFHVDNYLPSSYKFVATWILLCNSSVNRLIYVGLFRSVREKTAQMLRAGVCKLCKIR